MKEDSTQLPFFFIIGRPRSGTTLLRYLFDAHPNVVIPDECDFILSLSRRYKDVKILDEKTIQWFINDLMGCKHFETLEIDLNLLEQQMKAAGTIKHYSELCRMVQLSCKSVNDKSDILITGDKNPIYSSECFHKIYRLFPDARYIHLVRDYHDHIASMLTGKFLLSNAVYLSIAWKKSIRILAKYKKKYPEKFYTLRYEDFVELPEQSMDEMCNFLHIPYQHQIFEYYKKKDEYLANYPKIDFNNTHKVLFKPLNKDRIGNWTKVLKPKDIKTIEIITGKTGDTFGYKWLHHKIDTSSILALLKWHLLFYMAIFIRASVYSLPLSRRENILEKTRKNKVIRSLSSIILGRKADLIE